MVGRVSMTLRSKTSDQHQGKRQHYNPRRHVNPAWMRKIERPPIIGVAFGTISRVSRLLAYSPSGPRQVQLAGLRHSMSLTSSCFIRGLLAWAKTVQDCDIPRICISGILMLPHRIPETDNARILPRIAAFRLYKQARLPCMHQLRNSIDRLRL
jgi:hypothetical protein